MKKDILSKLLPLVIILTAAFFFYRSTLSYYFVGDDFPYISFSSLLDIPAFGINRYHYNPFFWLVMWQIRQVFGLNPFYFHLAAIIIHSANIILIFLLAKKILVSFWKAYAATLLFAFFFSHYEVVYWITGIATSLMVFFYLAGLIAFIAFAAKKKLRLYLIYFILFALSLFTHEYGITLPLVCSVYWLVYTKNKHKFKSLVYLNILPLIAIAMLICLKIFQSTAPLMIYYPGVFQIAGSVLKSFIYLLLPVPQIYDNIPRIVWVILGFGLICFVIKNLRSRLQLFLFLWFIVIVGFYSITSLAQARYFYPAAIPAILLMISVLASRRKLVISYFLLTLACSLVFLQQQKPYWALSSRIVKYSLTEFVRIYPKPDFSKTHYFINLPDRSNLSQWTAYVYRSEVDWALFLEYGQRPKVEYFNNNPQNDMVISTPAISSDKLEEIVNDDQPVFIYNPQSERLERLTKNK